MSLKQKNNTTVVFINSCLYQQISLNLISLNLFQIYHSNRKITQQQSLPTVVFTNRCHSTFNITQLISNMSLKKKNNTTVVFTNSCLYQQMSLNLISLNLFHSTYFKILYHCCTPQVYQVISPVQRGNTPLKCTREEMQPFERVEGEQGEICQVNCFNFHSNVE